MRRLIPPEVLDEARWRAESEPSPPASRLAGAAVIVVWLGLAIAGYSLWRAW